MAEYKDIKVPASGAKITMGPDGKLQATVGLSLQNRTVSFGPVPLFALQPIEWP